MAAYFIAAAPFALLVLATIAACILTIREDRAIERMRRDARAKREGGAA